MGGSALDVLWTVCYLSVLIGLSGRGDKDMLTLTKALLAGAR